MTQISSSDNYYLVQGSQTNQVYISYSFTDAVPNLIPSSITPTVLSSNTSDVAYYETDMTINKSGFSTETFSITLT